MKPAGWSGGHTYNNRGGVSMSYCTPVGPHIVTNQSVSRAYDFTAGVSTSGVIGINLSAQTGYSSGTEINFDTGNYGHPWCGRNGMPGNGSGGTPQLLTMHATRL